MIQERRFASIALVAPVLHVYMIIFSLRNAQRTEFNPPDSGQVCHGISNFINSNLDVVYIF